MIFLQKLTEHLVKNGVPENHLESWAEDGTIEAFGMAVNDGFERRYTANFEMSNVKIDPNFIDAVILSFLDSYDTNRAARGLEKPQFFVEPLQEGRFDIGYRIEFKEQCKFEPSETGDWQVNGQRMALVTNWQEPFEAEGELMIFDSVTQDLEK